jgi:hypothetical protein
MWMKRTALMTCLCLVIAVGSFAAWINTRSQMTIAPVKEVSSYVHIKSSIAIVFTSRSNTASLQPESPESEPYGEPVQVPWSASEGRLRLLDHNGRLFELTWGRKLADGSTIIDVMSPSVSLDGQRILFAGRKSEHDRWRIYQIHVDGSGLKQLTGGPQDPGCIAVPPLRFKADGSRLTDSERRKLDYDDIDPTDLGPNGFAFASSRLPDLGRDHSRRATQIWTWPLDATEPASVTANRNNDRWPFLIAGEQILFSLWSRSREAVKADLSDVQPVSLGGQYATRPANNWMAAVVMTNAAQFGYAIKSVEPVYRPRSLFNARIAFMTKSSPESPLRLAQADWGYIRTSPSSLGIGEDLPYEGGAELHFGPSKDAQGRDLIAACPSASPDHTVLFAGSVDAAAPKTFAIYKVAEDWKLSTPVPQMIFDDPEFVDAEPVAIYSRHFVPEPRLLTTAIVAYTPPESIKLASGAIHAGAMGFIENLAMSAAIRNPIPWHDRSKGQIVDPRANPLVSPPPNVAAITVYSANRDRFDDPEKTRILGEWEKQAVLPLLDSNAFRGWVPTDPLKPSVLVGIDTEGKVARWTGAASGDRPARNYFAYAGDHYSGIRPNSYQYCNGCHTGHTFLVLDTMERAGK